MIAWYKYLRALGFGRLTSLYSAVYNAQYLTTEGEWPYKMKMKE